jgi:hypothetical protein
LLDCNNFLKLADNMSRFNFTILQALVNASHNHGNSWGLCVSSLAPVCQVKGSIPLAWSLEGVKLFVLVSIIKVLI